MATPGETEEEAPPPIQRGIFDFEDGSTYEGEFIEVEGRPVRSGEGCWTLGPETSSGQWTDDAMQSGRITFASGSYFEGELRNGAYERGVFSWPDGSESVSKTSFRAHQSCRDKKNFFNCPIDFV